MVARKQAVAEPPAEETDGDEPVTKGEVRSIIREFLDEITGKKEIVDPPKSEETTEEPEEEIKSLRKEELDAEKAVRAALRDVNIHIGDHPSAQAKKEPEEPPGGKSFLTRLVGLG